MHGIFGKWHLGNPNEKNQRTPEALPLAHGFDQWLGTNVSHDYDNAKLLQSDVNGDQPVRGYVELGRDLPSHPGISASLTQRYTDAALSFIEQNASQPFFVYLAHNQPHLGLYASDAFVGRSRRGLLGDCLLYTSPEPTDYAASRMPSSA